MIIPLTFISDTADKPVRNQYILLLFEYLQKDKRFKEMVVTSRNRLGIKVENKTSEVKEKVKKRLRSTYKLKTIQRYDFNISVRLGLLEQEIDSIIQEYQILKDWRDGLSAFILDGTFLIPDSNSKIKIRVRNNKYYLGNYRDKITENSVNLIITSKISKKEIIDFINKKFPEIVYHLRMIPNLSLSNKRRKNFERDRFIVYLRDNLKLKLNEISELLQLRFNSEEANVKDFKEFSENALQKSYKDFPYRKRL